MNYTQISTKEYQDKLYIAWQHFINNEDFDYSIVRSEVLESWKRSKAANINPYTIVSTDILTPDELNVKINNEMQFIDIAHPYMEKLYSIIKNTGAYILLTDKDGYLLDYIGDQEIVIDGQTMTKLIPGACRSEKVAGTNAIGTAIYLEKPIQLWGHEHYCEKHQIYTCSCAPIFNSENILMGTINITLLKENAHPHTLGMVMSAADSISKEIKLINAISKIEKISAQRNTIIENITSGLFLLTHTHRISQVNKYALQMLGLSFEEVIGKNIFHVLSIDGSVTSKDPYIFLKKERYNEEASVEVITSNNPPKNYRVSVNFIKDLHGNITGTILRFNKPELINSLIKNVSGFNAHYTFHDIKGNSEVLQKMIHSCKKAALRSSNILIIGESGTGKELIAQSIHNASEMANGPFIALNCASLPKSLVESELFGYEKGAFTGADKSGRPGKFEMANGGTIFLDEIGDMPLDIQAALLRVIQTKEVVRIGGKYPIPINIRIIAATNKNLAEEVENKTFRSDLYYRLNVFTITPPPLRERGPSDIRMLAQHFVDAYNSDKMQNITISPEVFPVLESYSWPGNVRQLENAIERAINMVDTDNIIKSEHLPTNILVNYQQSFSKKNVINKIAENEHIASKENNKKQQVKLNVKENEKNLIISALQQTNGNVTKAANYLSMNLRTLYRKIDKHEIDVNQYRL